MRDGDRSAHEQTDAQRLQELIAGDLFFVALDDVMLDAIVASQDERGRETQQLLRLPGESTRTMGLRVKAEEPLDAQVTVLHHDLVQRFSLGLKVLDAASFHGLRLLCSSLASFKRAHRAYECAH